MLNKFRSALVGSRYVATSTTKDRIVGFRKRGLVKGKRALLAYLPEHVARYLNGEKIIRFSNNGIAIYWAIALADLGYEVDIVGWDENKVKIDRDYDVFIPHGSINFKSVMSQLKKRPIVIHFSTGAYWKFHNDQERYRFNDLYRRNGISLPKDRFLSAPDSAVYNLADYVISIGGKRIKDTYPLNEVMTVNNAAYEDARSKHLLKNHKRTKQNFLYFAGAGNVHKGLDLLIEAFSELDQNLYIMGHVDEEFRNAYQGLLQLPNINIVGEVVMRTKNYREGMKKCSFCILPSCSEGQPGSVIEAMGYGLIPIVSKECFIDTSNFGFTLKDCSIEQIRKLVRKTSSLDTKNIKQLSALARNEVEAKYRPKNFYANLSGHLSKII